MMMAALEQPAKMSRIPKVTDAIEHLSPQWENIEKPDYFDEVHAIQLPLINKDKPLFLQVDVPVLDINRLNSKDVLSSLHPVIKWPFESAMHGGHSFFLDSPIERFAGETSEGLGMERRVEYTMGSFFPPFSRYVSRPATAAQRDQLTEWGINEFLGLKFRSLDTRRVTRAKTYAKKKLVMEFKKIMEQEEEGSSKGLIGKIFGKKKE